MFNILVYIVLAEACLFDSNTRHAECLESSLRKKDLYILRTLTVLGQLSDSLLLENTKIKIFTKVFLILKTWQFIQLLR